MNGSTNCARYCGRVLAFGLFLSLAGCGPSQSEIDAKARKDKEQAAAAAAKEKAAKVAAEFNAMTPAEHLAAAQAMREKKNTTAAISHLKAIKSGTPEFASADKMLSAIGREAAAVQEAKEIAKNPVEVVKANWSKGGFGSVGLWTVTLKNRSDKPVGDIAYQTDYESETGNRVGRGSGVIQKVIPPKSSRTLEVNDGFINSQAHRAGFEISTWRYVADRR